MKNGSVLSLASCALLLAACSSAPLPVAAPVPTAAAAMEVPAGVDPFAPATETLTRTDSQGAISVEVTPLNLAENGAQLEFEVALNTHSVDLSMDLAALATLRTDTGVTVEASLWDAPLGGHHVSGTLIFGSATEDGRAILEGARKVTLTISGLDVPTRTFEWDLE